MIVVIFCNFLHCLVGGISVSIFVQFETKLTRKNKYSHQTLKASEARHFDQLLLSVSQHAWETLKAWAGRPSLFCKLEFVNSFVFLNWTHFCTAKLNLSFHLADNNDNLNCLNWGGEKNQNCNKRNYEYPCQVCDVEYDGLVNLTKHQSFTQIVSDTANNDQYKYWQLFHGKAFLTQQYLLQQPNIILVLHISK